MSSQLFLYVSKPSTFSSDRFWGYARRISNIAKKSKAQMGSKP